MKISASLHAGLLALLFVGPVSLGAETPEAGSVDFGKITAPAEGGTFVEVRLGSNLIAMVARLAESGEPEAAELLRGLKQVRVNVVSLDDGNRAEVQERVRTLRQTLDSGGWERVVTVQEQKEDVGVYVKARGQEAVEGVVVTVLSGDKEAVLVNVVGDIRPEKLAQLGERLNIEPLKRIGKSIAKP